MTGLDSNEQSSSNIDYDKLSSIGKMFKFFFSREPSEDIKEEQ